MLLRGMFLSLSVIRVLMISGEAESCGGEAEERWRKTFTRVAADDTEVSRQTQSDLSEASVTNSEH